MPRPSRRQRSEEEEEEEEGEPMDVSEVSSVDQTVIDNPHTITFTRCLLLNRITTEEEMTALYRQIFTDDAAARNFKDVLQEINDSLQGCKIKIVRGRCEVTDNSYYLVIPTYFKPAQVWPNIMFKEPELAFIKTVINEMIVSDVGLVSLERVVRKHEFINSKEAKKVLEKLVEENYLIEPRQGKYGLSVLAVHELEPYFHYSFKDIMKKCAFCKRFMYFGGFCHSCKGNGRTTSGHVSCVAKYKESMKTNSIKCPSCNKEWSRNVSESIEDLFDYEELDD